MADWRQWCRSQDLNDAALEERDQQMASELADRLGWGHGSADMSRDPFEILSELEENELEDY